MHSTSPVSVMFSQFLYQWPSVHRGGGGWVSGKVHSEHILATILVLDARCRRGGVTREQMLSLLSTFRLLSKVLMPEGGGGRMPGKCTIQVMSQGMSTFLAYQRNVCTIDIRIAFLLYDYFYRIKSMTPLPPPPPHISHTLTSLKP